MVSKKRVLLKRNPEILKEYDDVTIKQENEGIVETVDLSVTQNIPGGVHYIPHPEVIRRDKATSKLRVVYDASTRNNGPSLNDCLEAGPSLLPKIFEIMARFRSYTIGITNDIQSAFLNIRVEEKDRDYLRFLWFDDITKSLPEVIVKRFTSVLFGVSSSPFLIGDPIICHMEQFNDIEPEIIFKFLQDLYMNDSISGSQTSHEGFNFLSL